MDSNGLQYFFSNMIRNTNLSKIKLRAYFINKNWQNSFFCLELRCKRLVRIMYQNKLNLTPNDILEKEFKIDTRGYRLKEVDQYLDLIIHDYETLIEIIKKQEKEKDELADEIMKLKQELRDANVNIEIAKAAPTSSGSISNLDILKRLSNLEKTIYGKEDN